MPHFLRPFLEGKLREDWDRLLYEKLPEPTMADFTQFIEQRLLWADTQHSMTTFTPSSSSTTSPFQPKQASRPSSPRTRANPKCPHCFETHWLGRCPAFIAMDVDDRNKLVREKRLCLNCFSNSHDMKNCFNKHSCRNCNQRHHTYLHREQKPSNSTIPATPTPDTAMSVITKTEDDTPATLLQRRHESKGNFVCTVVASIQNGEFNVKARVLLDHGSGATFMSEELASTLKLKRYPQDRLFEGFNPGTIRSRFYVIALLQSINSDFVSPPIEFSVVSHGLRTTSPEDKEVVAAYAAEKGLTLSDPDMGGHIDILLGQEYPWDFCGRVQKIERHRYIDTCFGIGVIGPVHGRVNVLSVSSASPPLAQCLSRLWELDKVPEASVLSPVDQSVVQHYHNNVQVVNNRISVSLPVKDNAPPLGNSRKQAISRLYANERSLSAKDKLDAFNTALREYLSLGHAHIIPSNELKLNDSQCYYMPVHGVFKDSSTTTKVRPVFDASAKTTSGFSLNETLDIGPNLYPPLADILVKFRRHAIGFSADISKMFREILLNPEHRDLHRFVLREPTGSIVDCRMERVTFGVNCSPYLATQTLRFIADLHQETRPNAAKAIRSEFYVDDYVSGADSVVEANKIRTELCNLLDKAGMTLRKWRSNSEDFLALTPPSLREETGSSLNLSDSQTPKALGVHWNVHTDTLHVSTPAINIDGNTKVTKRIMASVTAGVFDILGLFSPAIITARILLQDTWKKNIPWDKPVPQEIRDKWESWIEDLHKIVEHPIPRRITALSGKSIFISLHGFSDASSVAYGAVPSTTALYKRMDLFTRHWSRPSHGSCQ